MPYVNPINHIIPYLFPRSPLIYGKWVDTLGPIAKYIRKMLFLFLLSIIIAYPYQKC